MSDVFYVSGPRDWPLIARIAAGVVLASSLPAAGWLVTRGDVVSMAAGVALGAAGAGAFAAFLRSLRRLRWFVLDEKEIRTEDGRSVAYREIDRMSVEDVRGAKALLLQSPRVDLRVPLFRGRRDLLVGLSLFVARLEDRMQRPRGSIARLARGEAAS
ncbi:MAG: hypothetical protein HYY17_09865 [Planctomycetes bacterium]|nr:hypothetical protein [Planctomycetota bacterium]